MGRRIGALMFIRCQVESVTQAVCDLALRFGESVHDEDAMMVCLLLSPNFEAWSRCNNLDACRVDHLASRF